MNIPIDAETLDFLSPYIEYREFFEKNPVVKKALKKEIVERAHDSFPSNYVPDTLEVNKAILEQIDVLTEEVEFGKWFINWLKNQKGAKINIQIQLPKK